MRKKQNIMRVTAEQAAEIAASEDRTDWARVKAMPQSEVERLADEEDGKLSEGWADTIVFSAAEPKQDVHIRLDASVLRWFKAEGPGYQTRITEVLRSFVAARENKAFVNNLLLFCLDLRARV
jgi:uncharacterized protein (DUF4415 family)